MIRLLFLSLISLVFYGCSLIDNSDESKDFGIVVDQLNIVAGEKEYLRRNRNFIWVKFTDDQNLEEIRQLVLNNDLEFISPDDDPVKHSYTTKLKVRSKPAEEYYTHYGSSDASVFGNLDKVVYALPIFELPEDVPEDGFMFISDELTVIISDQLSEQDVQVVLDSLKTTDNLTGIVNDWDEYRFRFQVRKSSPMNSLDLSNHYETLSFVVRATPEIGYAIQRDPI